MDSKRQNEHDATPELSLYKLPSKQRKQIVMSTPPLNKLASIPFQWEEAPGKPRAIFTKANAFSSSPHHHNKSTTAARCLDLPPRLLNTSTNNAPSPTTVLDGPYSYSSPSLSFSLPKVSFRSLQEELSTEGRCGKKDNDYKESRRLKLTSWRWGSFKESSNRVIGDGHSFSTCTSIASRKIHRSASKLSRVERKSSFLRISQTSSNLLAGVYGSFKQMVPWRRRQE